MRISDWSSDVCSSDLECALVGSADIHAGAAANGLEPFQHLDLRSVVAVGGGARGVEQIVTHRMAIRGWEGRWQARFWAARTHLRSEEQTSELQSLMRNSYAVFCLKNKKIDNDREESE